METHDAERNRRRLRLRKAVDAGRDCGEGDRSDVPRFARASERTFVRILEELWLVTLSSVPNRSDRVNHVSRRQPIRARDDGAASGTMIVPLKLGEQFRTGAAVNRAVHT